MIQERALSLSGLRYSRDAHVRMRQSSTVRPYIFKQRPSETLARLALIKAYDLFHFEQEASEKQLIGCYGTHVVQNAPEDYLLSNTKDNGYLDLVSFHLWKEIAEFIHQQYNSVGNYNRNHLAAWMQVEKMLCQPIYEPFMKYYFGLLFSFLVQVGYPPSSMKNKIEIVYIILAGYLAAHIKIYPELALALERAYPGLRPAEAILWELPGEAVLLAPLFVESNFSINKIPAKAAENIRANHQIPTCEYLTNEALDITTYPGPLDRILDCEEAQFYLDSFTPQQRRIALLKADGHDRAEIAEVLNIAEESVKKQIGRFQHKAKRMRLARN